MGKKLSVISACLSLCILLPACGLFSKGQATPVSPNPMVTISPNMTLTPTSGPSPSHIPPRPTLTPTIETTPSQIPYPTLLPTLEPTKIPGLLEQAFSFHPVKSLNGHSTQQISGWGYGFKGYEWLDVNHLFLHPIVGQVDSPNSGRLVETYPAVINLRSEKVWIPPVDGATRWDITNGYLPRWSAKLGIMINSEMNSSGYFVAIYDPDGTMLSSYPGELLGVSPSGTKILVADDTWIDLTTGKTVDFAWYKDHEAFYFPRPIWSDDETRVYMCCYLYGDASTGVSYGIRANEFSVDGKKVGQTLFHSDGEWVFNDNYLLVQWDFFYDSNPGFVPLFDPAAKTYRNLNALAGIPADFMGEPNCIQTSPAPDGQYVWLECYDGDYLVNLATYESQAYPDYSNVEIHWSVDSKFAWLENSHTDGNRFQILSVFSKELKPFPANPLDPIWHPTEAILAYISEDKQTLSLINAGNGAVQEVGLPTVFQEIVWSPIGDHIALLAADGSLWQMDYPNLETLEQLTQPRPDVKDVAWSPDGAFLSFVSRVDIYIVEVNVNP